MLHFSFVPRPTFCKEKGLADFEPFLVFADLTVQDPGLSIKLQACALSCDKGILLCNATQYCTIPLLNVRAVILNTCMSWYRRFDDDATVHGIGSVHDCIVDVTDNQ